MKKDKDNLEKLYQKLNDDEYSVLKKWNESVIPKTILLFPLIAFIFTYLKVNTDKSTLDLISFIALGGLFVSGGIFLNYLLTKGKWIHKKGALATPNWKLNNPHNPTFINNSTIYSVKCTLYYLCGI